MSNFGSISLPGTAAANKALGRGGQAIQIISVPNNLKNVAKALRLSGEITQVSTNGIVRIETPEGRIDAQIRNARAGQTNLQTGQPIDIEIPAGRPPQQATLRPPSVSLPTDQNSARPNQGTVNQSAQNITTPNPSNNAQQNNNASRDNYIRPEQNFIRNNRTQPIQAETVRAPAPTQQATPLQQDATVRLLALPPAQAQKIATDFLQTVQPQPSALTRVPVTANLIADNIQTQTLNNALQIKTPILQSNIGSLTPNAQNITAPILNSNFLQSTIPTQTAQINILTATIQPSTTLLSAPVNGAVPIANTALLTPDVAGPLLQNIPVAQATATTTATPPSTQITGASQNQAPIQTTLTPAPITFDPTNPIALQNSSVAKIDIQIVNIQPPQAVLTSVPQTTQNITTPLVAPPVQTNAVSAAPQQQVIPAATNFTPPLLNTNNNAVTLTAQVTGFTAQGLPLVTIPSTGRAMPQSFVMQYNSNNLQLGSQIQITTKNPVLAQQAQSTQAPNPLMRGFQWPALNQLHQSLFQISPQAASSLLRSLPTPTNAQQIAPAAMMFIAAVKSGNIAQFIGQNKNDMIEKAGKENILRALSQESSATSRVAEPASTAEWRAVPLPMFWEGEIQKVSLYTRHEFQDDNKKENNGNEQTRFIFDLELSRMGEMQIDGYLKDQRLDLIIRSQNIFSEPMQQTMRQAYSNALDHTDLKGELNFQGSTKHWVHVLEQAEQLGVHI